MQCMNCFYLGLFRYLDHFLFKKSVFLSLSVSISPLVSYISLYFVFLSLFLSFFSFLSFSFTLSLFYLVSLSLCLCFSTSYSKNLFIFHRLHAVENQQHEHPHSYHCLFVFFVPKDMSCCGHFCYLPTNFCCQI